MTSRGATSRSPGEHAAWRPSSSALDISGGRPRSGSFLHRSWSVLARERLGLVQLALLTALVHLLALAIPLATQLAVDTALPNGAESLLVVLGLAIAAAAACRAWLSWLRQGVVHALAARVEASLLHGLFDHAIRVRLTALQTQSAGDLLRSLSSASSLSVLMTGHVALPVVDAVFAVSYLALIAWHLPGLAAVATGVGTALVIVSAWAARRYAAAQDRALNAAGRQRSTLDELIEGAPTIKAAGAESYAVARWRGSLADFQTASLEGSRIGLWLEFASEAASQVLTVLVLVWGAAQCLRGEITIGVLLSSVLLGQTFMNSLLHMSQAALPLWGSRSDLERVNRILRLESECADARPVALASAAISMTDVWFRYSTDGPWILQGYHLHVLDGELHEISGPSGCGKTTILRLLAGMLRPERGQVEVGGRDPFGAHDGAIAYLPQETYLFEGTIMDNLVRMSRASVSDILAAAEATGLAAMVTELPMKYDTPVPPGGRTLSGGQRQLIAVTACSAGRARVLLLDEGFAHMDRITRDPLRCGRVFGGKTVVAVQHDRLRSESER